MRRSVAVVHEAQGDSVDAKEERVERACGEQRVGHALEEAVQLREIIK